MNEEYKTGQIRIIAMRGLPRSGKSTVAKRISSRFGHPIVSRDAIRLALHGKYFIAELEPDVTVLETQVLRSLAYAGHRTIIIDECNCDAVYAEDKIKGYFEGTDFSVHVEFAVIDTPVDVCVERAIATEQFYIIPVIKRMQVNWTS